MPTDFLEEISEYIKDFLSSEVYRIIFADYKDKRVTNFLLEKENQDLENIDQSKKDILYEKIQKNTSILVEIIKKYLITNNYDNIDSFSNNQDTIYIFYIFYI